MRQQARNPILASLALTLTLSLALALLPAGLEAASGDLASRLATSKVLDKSPDDEPIPGQYIVSVAEGVDPASVSRSVEGDVLHVYRAAFNGFAARLTDEEVQELSARDDVLFLEQDHRVTTQEVAQIAPPSWGLDRIDQRFLQLDDEYWYYTDAGNVHAYVLDTGIYAGHLDFGGRVDTSPGGGFTAIHDGNGTHDCHGHGTHVAGTVGGETFGVAKQVALHPVRVLNCFGAGTFAGVIAGVDWVTANHVKPAVANMSLGGSFNLSLNMAVDNSVTAGVFYAVAAGNSNSDACTFSPAGAALAFTAGATDAADQRPLFSNFGPCIDLFAPGVAITSAWNSSPTASQTLSGTSMASPHAAGTAALYLAEYPLASANEVRQAVLAAATPDVVLNPGPGSPNLLLYSRLGSRLHEVSGSLSLLGQENIHPLGSFFFARVAGPHEARLEGPAAGADFDLELYRFDPGLGVFLQVASSNGPTAEEHLIFHGTPGLYYWRVSNAGGSGPYDLSYSQP